MKKDFLLYNKLKFLSSKSVSLYFIALTVVSLIFLSHAMKFYWILFGAISVIVFFYYSSHFSSAWQNIPQKVFISKLFKSALFFRLLFVIFSYYFFLSMNGNSFEFSAGDSMGYNDEAVWIVDLIKYNMLDRYFEYISNKHGVSDMGYPFYLGIQYLITNKSIFIARIIKSFLSAYTCIFIYKIAARNFGEKTGRLAGIFVMLMPNLIMYCGMHLKETEMLFVMSAFIERTDFFLRTKKIIFKNIILPLLLGVLLFFFRTALGLVAIFSLVTTVFFSTNKIINKGKRLVIGFWLILAVSFFAGGTIAMEIEKLWQAKDTNQKVRLEDRAKKGNVFAAYASKSVFAPLIFTLPFPTMIETPNQETFRMLHGGVYIKNIMSFFTILGIILLIRQKKWKEHLFLLTFLISYLGILAVSAYAQSERFHIPAIPLEMVLAAFGISQMKQKHIRWFKSWNILMFFVIIAWSWFKLKGRGAI